MVTDGITEETSDAGTLRIWGLCSWPLLMVTEQTEQSPTGKVKLQPGKQLIFQNKALVKPGSELVTYVWGSIWTLVSESKILALYTQVCLMSGKKEGERERVLISMNEIGEWKVGVCTSSEVPECHMERQDSLVKRGLINSNSHSQINKASPFGEMGVAGYLKSHPPMGRRGNSFPEFTLLMRTSRVLMSSPCIPHPPDIPPQLKWMGGYVRTCKHGTATMDIGSWVKKSGYKPLEVTQEYSYSISLVFWSHYSDCNKSYLQRSKKQN